MAQAYFSLVTTLGRIKLAASAAGGDPVVITHFAVGDGNGAETNPTAASTALVREVWRSQVESVVVDPDNPSAVLVTAIIPTAAGGWWMREFGIFDEAGAMIAVARPVSQYKPTALEGQLEDIRYEFQIIIGETANVTLLVDPTLLFATREWVMTRKIPMAQMMRTPWLPIVSMTVTVPPAAPAIGDIYLVPAAASGAWAAHVGELAEWTGSAWSFLTPPNGHGISLPDGRIYERMGGAYLEKIALDVQSGKWSYAVAGGTANALTITLNPAPASHADLIGAPIRIKATASVTGAATLNVNGLGVKAMVNTAGQPLARSDIVTGQIVTVAYDGTRFQLLALNPAAMPVRLTAVFDAPGATNWTVPAGVYYIWAKVWGGGGGGGGSYGAGAGAGGNGGGYAEGIYAVNPGDVLLISVGVAGAGGGAGLSGTAGNSSSIGSLISASGGGGGGAGSNGAGVTGTSGNGSGGNVMNIQGFSGQYGNVASGFSQGGLGGSAFGSGICPQPICTSPSPVSGNGGSAPGGGGGGGASISGGGTSGGNGGNGRVIIQF